VNDREQLLREARHNLTAASNYIDTLGGVSQKYRQFVARISAALESPVMMTRGCHSCAHQDSPGAKGQCKSCSLLWKPENGGHTDNWEPLASVGTKAPEAAPENAGKG
jgi:hypothetical protein